MGMLDQLSKAARLLFFYPALSLFPISFAYKVAPLISPMPGGFQKRYMRKWVAGMKRCMELGNLVLSDEKDIYACARNHVRMLSYEALDTFLVPRLTPLKMKKISRVNGTKHIEAALERKKGLIIVTSHFCRLNMTAYSLGHMGIRNGILSQSVGKDNPYLDWVDRLFLKNKLKRYYKVTKGPGLTLKDNPRLIYKALERNEIMVILLDAFPDTIKNFYHLPFLGGTICLARGIARISKKTGAPLVYATVKPEEEWQVKVELEPVAKTGEEGFFETVRKFEADVRQLPCQWWQWPYMESMWQETA